MLTHTHTHTLATISRIALQFSDLEHTQLPWESPPRHVRDRHSKITPNVWDRKRWLVRFIPVGHYMLSATIIFVSLTYSGLQVLVGQRIYVSFPANNPIVEIRLATVEHRQYRIVKIFAV